MDKKRVKKVCHQIAFYILLVLAVGYLPSQIGFNLLWMAILMCPIHSVRNLVDKFLEISSGRFTWYVILFYCLGCYPLSDFGIIINRIKYILNLIPELIN